MLDFENYTFRDICWILETILSGYILDFGFYFPGYMLDFGNYTFRDLYWILETILSGYMLDFGNYTFGIYTGFWKLLAGIYAGFWILLSRIFADFFSAVLVPGNFKLFFSLPNFFLGDR